MKYISRVAWIGYFIFYLGVSLGGLLNLVLPQEKSFVFYHTLMVLNPLSVVSYASALLAAALSVISLGPLYARTFGAPRVAIRFFKAVFYLRLLADLSGHTYESLFVKALWVNRPLTAVSVVVLTIAIIYPSYKALYEYAFAGVGTNAGAKP